MKQQQKRFFSVQLVQIEIGLWCRLVVGNSEGSVAMTWKEVQLLLEFYDIHERSWTQRCIQSFMDRFLRNIEQCCINYEMGQQSQKFCLEGFRQYRLKCWLFQSELKCCFRVGRNFDIEKGSCAKKRSPFNENYVISVDCWLILSALFSALKIMLNIKFTFSHLILSPFFALVIINVSHSF